LLANPDARLEVDGREEEYHASQATDDKRDHFWQMAVNTNIGYARYQERTGRRIPIMVLTPRNYPGGNTPKRKIT